MSVQPVSIKPVFSRFFSSREDAMHFSFPGATRFRIT